MAKIVNIGVLDVREIADKLAEQITEIANVGAIIENEESQLLLKNCKRVNIGATIKIPNDVKVKFISQNGEMILDKDYLEGLLEPVILLVNGSLFIENDVDINFLNEKIYSIIVNGQLICPKNLIGIIQSKGTVNGEALRYNNGYKYIEGNVMLTNRFLKGLKPNSKLAFEKLIVIEDIDIKLLEDRIANIQVLEKLILADELEDNISQYIDEYFSVDKTVLPNASGGIKYIDDDTSLNASSIKKYSHNVLYVDGDVEISLDEDIVFSEYIDKIICDTVICNEETYEIIKTSIGDDVEVKIIRGKLLENSGKMTLTGEMEGEVTIRNMGKLILDEKLDYDNFNTNVVSISNYGLILAPESKLNIVKNKVAENFGKVMSLEEKEKNAWNKFDQADEEILYANVGELKL